MDKPRFKYSYESGNWYTVNLSSTLVSQVFNLHLKWMARKIITNPTPKYLQSAKPVNDR